MQCRRETRTCRCHPQVLWFRCREKAIGRDRRFGPVPLAVAVGGRVNRASIWVAERTNSEVKDILRTDWFSLWLPELGPCAQGPSGLAARGMKIRRHSLTSG